MREHGINIYWPLRVSPADSNKPAQSFLEKKNPYFNVYVYIFLGPAGGGINVYYPCSDNVLLVP